MREDSESSGQPVSQDYAAVDALFQQAFGAHRRGLLSEADALYQRLLAQAPDHFDARHFHGVLLHQRGLHEPALEQIRQAIALDPAQPAAHANAGLVLYALGRLQEALDSFDRALEFNADLPDTWANRANALAALKRPAEALSSYDRALALRPDFVEALMHRGHVLFDLRRFEEALASYDRALALDATRAEALAGRGSALFELKRYEDAVSALDRALLLDDANLVALSNRGAALVEMKRPEEALASLERALQLNPDAVTALFNRGIALRDLKRPQEAVISFSHLVDIAADFPYALGYLFNSRLHCCDWTDHPGTTARIAAAVASGARVDAPFSFLAVSDSAPLQLRCAQTWAADTGIPMSSQWGGGHYGHEKIRIAYLSADYAEHPTPYLIVELFEKHDRTRFEVFAISFGPDSEGAMRTRLRDACDQFIDVRGRSDRDVAALLRSFEIDIAVDLMGYTQGNRMAIFAQRAAPVQVNYLGYPGTMGAGCFDYILADPWVIPPEHESAYAEKVARLPDMYQVNDRKRVIAAHTPARDEAGLPACGFVFCCFNNSFKIAPAMFDIWMRLLGRVEGSVLFLYADNDPAMTNLRKEAKARGIDPARLVFGKRLPPPEYLARYRVADLFLDTLPYNAHTTASDALRLGLPVLTCAGTTFAGRVAAGLLCAMGLPELVTSDLVAYEQLAFRLATEPGLLSAIKSRLAQNRATAPLFDTDRFRCHIEQAYETMHERSRRGLLPEAFDVRPQL